MCLWALFFTPNATLVVVPRRGKSIGQVRRCAYHITYACGDDFCLSEFTNGIYFEEDCGLFRRSLRTEKHRRGELAEQAGPRQIVKGSLIPMDSLGFLRDP